MSTRLSVSNEFYKLYKNIETKTKGQAKIVDFNPECLYNFSVLISPKKGYYAHGTFLFSISMQESYPANPPEVNCLSEIYHPNIDTDGQVCLNLFSDWSPLFGLEDVIQGLIFLFYQPNLNDPLTSVFRCDISEEEFADNVKKFLRGEAIICRTCSGDEELLAMPNPGFLEYESALKRQNVSLTVAEGFQEELRCITTNSHSDNNLFASGESMTVSIADPFAVSTGSAPESLLLKTSSTANSSLPQYDVDNAVAETGDSVLYLPPTQPLSTSLSVRSDEGQSPLLYEETLLGVFRLCEGAIPEEMLASFDTDSWTSDSDVDDAGNDDVSVVAHTLMPFHSVVKTAIELFRFVILLDMLSLNYIPINNLI